MNKMILFFLIALCSNVCFAMQPEEEIKELHENHDSSDDDGDRYNFISDTSIDKCNESELEQFLDDKQRLIAQEMGKNNLNQRRYMIVALKVHRNKLEMQSLQSRMDLLEDTTVLLTMEKRMLAAHYTANACCTIL